MNPSPSESILEQTLRSQREAWRRISLRIGDTPIRDFPPGAPKRILLIGVGSSHHAARLTAWALLRDRTRERIPIIARSSTAVGSDLLPTQGDWIFAFSHSGKTPATLAALQLAERAGAFPILVSAEGVPTPSFVRHHLTTVPRERIEPHTVGVTGAICAVTSLLMGAKALEEWDALTSIGDPSLELLRRRAGNGPSVVIGEFEGEWIAREAALKLLEVARLPVLSYSSEEFFHGPSRMMSESDPLWHISMPKDPRNSELRPQHQIGVFGASPLAFVPALVEVQWLALAVALNRGLDPDLAPLSP
jgi:glucosamine--fructose-6-phosphate aminotransferase (isomerizing)